MPPRERADELTRAYTAHLADEEAMTPIVDEGLQEVAAHTMVPLLAHQGGQAGS